MRRFKSRQDSEKSYGTECHGGNLSIVSLVVASFRTFNNRIFLHNSELIRNQTLKFLSKTLPILKADDTLPKVTQVVENDLIENNDANRRTYDEEEESGHDLHDDDYEPEMTEKRSRSRRQADPNRNSRKFCDGGGVFCALYRAIQGEPINSQLIAERREETVPVQPQYQGPPTPCPAKVEYVTPVFAKNFQGSWRYVVQIPYEGYFTQTVEVTRCLQTKCHYLGELSIKSLP